ncbi:MAG: DUF4186 domain-containing protein [Bacilli bacterium]|nr:DUF4186 domain-containing protein [Bacilli bacterium]
MGNNKEIINKKLEDLSKSKFRSSFKLRKYMIDYINNIGMNKIKDHAYDFIKERLAGANPVNDGKQTPMKGHPVFIAQHACACCCRNCLEKWHHIPKGRELTNNEINYVVALLLEWIIREYKNNN